MQRLNSVRFVDLNIKRKTNESHVMLRSDPQIITLEDMLDSTDLEVKKCDPYYFARFIIIRID